MMLKDNVVRFAHTYCASSSAMEYTKTILKYDLTISKNRKGVELGKKEIREGDKQ